ncbi:hypothetical protein EZS27_043013, partial [termite gut metagenome]
MVKTAFQYVFVFVVYFYCVRLLRGRCCGRYAQLNLTLTKQSCLILSTDIAFVAEKFTVGKHIFHFFQLIHIVHIGRGEIERMNHGIFIANSVKFVAEIVCF